MSAYHVLEWLIVAAAVGGSAWAVVRRLRPRARAGDSQACSSCDSCSGCGSASSPKTQESPIRWH